MSTRILHCGKSLENYYTCINSKVAGFMQRGQLEGDLIYFAVKVGKYSFCGARAKLIETTDYKPWKDSELYISCFKIDCIEFCKPFNLNLMRNIGGKYWVLKFVQSSKTINNVEAVELLKQTFESNSTNELFIFPEEIIDKSDEELQEIEEEYEQENESEFESEKINIMATFQSISFKNESDRISGLETLVNNNFHSLFPQYPESRSILIPENRIFITSVIENKDTNLTGIRGIPDALLLLFNKTSEVPFQCNLIEYEAYGQTKLRIHEKSNYLNGHIIPQLMRFASTFSIVTEKQIRENTIQNWSDKIITYIYSDSVLQEKMTGWIKDIYKDINAQLIGLKIKQLITHSLRTNLKIILIIDELSTEQKDTISNVIKAFKLENNTSIQFLAYVVRLEQKIKMLAGDLEYALSVQ